MKLQEVIRPDAVNLSLTGSDKEQVLGELVDLLVSSGIINQRQAMLDSLLEREGLGSTGIGYGVAIPHGRCRELESPAVALGRTERDVDFDSVDGKPARLFFLLVAPENGNNDHLHLLAKIARLMKDAGTRDRLLNAESPEAALLLIGERDDA